jgi:glycosyltransferase involved in cell wall biosynthesis
MSHPSGRAPSQCQANLHIVSASHRVPFVTEYLLGNDAKSIGVEEEASTIQLGRGAVVVQADDIAGFAQALGLLLIDKDLRSELGHNAFQATVPYFSWPRRMAEFLEQIGIVQ